VRTRDKLAAELRKVAEKASPENAAKYEAFAKRAETGEFDDFADTYVCPITQLYMELSRAGFTKFAERVADGEFDATKEESDEWARSPEGQELAKQLSPRHAQGSRHGPEQLREKIMADGERIPSREEALASHARAKGEEHLTKAMYWFDLAAAESANSELITCGAFFAAAAELEKRANER
jgi:hypothetical protein